MSAISRSTWRQALAITGAQWRIARNRLPRANVFGLIFTGLSVCCGTVHSPSLQYWPPSF